MLIYSKTHLKQNLIFIFFATDYQENRRIAERVQDLNQKTINEFNFKLDDSQRNKNIIANLLSIKKNCDIIISFYPILF